MELKPVVELEQVAQLSDAPPLNSAPTEILAKKKVLELIQKELPKSDIYPYLMKFYQELLSEVNDDELAYEIYRLVQRTGSKTDSVVALRMMNDGMESEKLVLGHLDGNK